MRIERNVFMAGRRSKTHPYKAVRENGEVICYGATKDVYKRQEFPHAVPVIFE